MFEWSPVSKKIVAFLFEWSADLVVVSQVTGERQRLIFQYPYLLFLILATSVDRTCLKGAAPFEVQPSSDVVLYQNRG